MAQTTLEKKAKVSVENVGGIKKTEIEFQPGVSILTGQNATNRTSLLQALNAALGGEMASVHTGADEASVEMDLGGETYTRTFKTVGKGVSFDGDPYTKDTEIVDLFATLIEDNKIRRNIRNGADSKELRDLLMAPVDEEEIQQEINSLTERQRTLKSELNTIKNKNKQLENLNKQVNTLEREIEELEAKIEEKESELENIDEQEEESEQHEAEEYLDKLETKQSKKNTLEREIRTNKESLERTRSQIEDKKSELEDAREELEDLPSGGVSHRIQELQEQINNKNDKISALNSISNSVRKLTEQGSDIRAMFITESSEGAVTDTLVEGEQIECPVCGSEVREDQIESHDVIDEKLDKLQTEIEEQEDERDDLQQRRQNIRQAENRVDSLENEISQLETEIENREEKHERKQDELDAVEDEIAELEQKVEEAQEERESERVEVRQELNSLQNKLGRKENQLEDKTNQIEEYEAAVEKKDDYEEEKKQVEARKEELKNSVRNREDDIVDEFNDTVEEVMTLLNYENIEKISLKRKTKNKQDSVANRFDLQIARYGNEEEVSHLSESEREVLGIIVALTGFIVHDISDEVPMLLLDSLEAIDAERISDLIQHFDQTTDFVIAALLEEDSEALPDDYTRIQATAF